VPDNNSSLFEEFRSAGRGVVALVVGDRRAGDYFVFSLRGLAGSFIAFIAITGLNAALPTLLGFSGPSASITRSVVMIVVLYTMQIAFSALVLRQLKRLDGLLPYLVADNWATFFITLVSTALALFGLAGDFLVIAIGILVIVVEINIARLIVTLSPLQIAMFLVAQLVGVSIGLLLIGGLFPPSPADLEALAAAVAAAGG
jgi:hypothetical protein